MNVLYLITIGVFALLIWHLIVGVIRLREDFNLLEKRVRKLETPEGERGRGDE